MHRDSFFFFFLELRKLRRSGCLFVLADVHMPSSVNIIMQCHMELLVTTVPWAKTTCKRYLYDMHGSHPPTDSCRLGISLYILGKKTESEVRGLNT